MTAEETTRSLVEEARGGSRAAFEKLAAASRGRLLALVEARLGRALRARLAAEDVVQETFLRAFRSLERFEPAGEDSFCRWLGGIAAHVIQEAARREKRDLIVPLLDEVPAGGPSPSKTAARGERFERLQAALDTLSPEHRQVILLARVERLPMTEVARRLERSPQAASQLLWRALGKLKEAFGATDSFHLPPRRLEVKGGSDDARPR
jgi:RNA polymerase sigma-70 factor (ECF subfamily)